MKSDVFYFTARTQTHKESLSKIKGPLALKELGIEKKIKKGDKIVIKTHFEEKKYEIRCILLYCSDSNA